MKIAYVTDVMSPFTKGGSEKRIWEIAKRLAKENDVHIYTFSSANSLNESKHMTLEGVNFHFLGRVESLYDNKERRSLKTTFLFSTNVLSKLLHQNFDIIDCNQSPLLHIFPSRIASLCRCPLVVTWHEVWGDYWYKYLGKNLGLIGKTVENIIARVPSGIIAVSSKTKDRLFSMYGRSNKVYLVHNGVDLEEIKNSKPSKDKYDIVFVGRLAKSKKVDVLIKSTALLLKDIPHLKCAIIGDGPQRENLERLTIKLGVQDAVKFFGRLKNDFDVISILKSSKLFISCSVLEGFGIVLMEANACGLPVIAIKHPNNAASELIRDGKNGFLVNLSPYEISQKALLLLRNEEMRLSLGGYGAEFSKEFDWSKVSERTFKIYTELLSGSRYRRN